MKKTYHFLIALAATVVFAACSSNDDVAATEPTSESDGNTYMSVRIAMPGSTSGASSNAKSRTATSGIYEKGSEAEYTVTSARFLFFDPTTGAYKTFGHTLESISQTTKENKNNVESTIAATVVLGPTTIYSALKMITLLNYSEGEFNSLIGKSLEDVLKTTTKVDNNTNSKAGDFVMSTSAYVGGETSESTEKKALRYTYVPATNFQKTAEDAKNKPVDVYVERTVAKVVMTPASTQSDGVTVPTADNSNNPTTYTYPITISGDEGVSTFNIDEKDGNLAVKILGWAVNGYNENGYLVKKISAASSGDSSPYYYLNESSSNTTNPVATEWSQDTTATTTEKTPLSDHNGHWNMAVDSRSFWAEDINYGTGTSTTYSGTSTDNDGSRTGLKYWKLSEFTDGTTGRVGKFDSQYVYENTVDQRQAWFTGGEQNPNVTCMLVVGKVGKWSKDESESSESWKAFDTDGTVFRINGAYYSESYIKSLLFNKYHKDKSGTKTALTESDITFNLPGSSSNDGTPLVTILCTSVTTGSTGKEKKEKIGNITGFTIEIANNANIYESSSATTAITNANIEMENYLYSALHVQTTDAENSTNTDSPKKQVLATDQKIECFKEGYCYYQIPIEQPAPTPSENGQTNAIYGIVRNHSYHLNLQNVTNIGDPIFDYDQPLEPIPGKETYYYMGAKINVLEWRDVTQDVTL